MRDDGFGQVRGVDVRELWQHEERDFTPWLVDNKERLEAFLGLDIELDGREHVGGPFELDLIVRGTSGGSPATIENQPEGSDHRHLGQLLTYADGVGASTVKWPTSTPCQTPVIRSPRYQPGGFVTVFLRSAEPLPVAAVPIPHGLEPSNA